MKKIIALAIAILLALGCLPAFGEYETLEIGSKGSAVVALQEHLILFGYLDGKADGAYGKGTAAGVKAFQKAAGLEETGTADPATQEALFALELPEITFRGAKFGSTANEVFALWGEEMGYSADGLWEGEPAVYCTVADVVNSLDWHGRYENDPDKQDLRNVDAVAYTQMYDEGVWHIAGYDVVNPLVLFLNPVKDGKLAESKGDYLLYYGRYVIDAKALGYETVRDDLTTKLSTLYGNYVETDGMRIWKGANEVQIVLKEHEAGGVGWDYCILSYVWTGGERVYNETLEFLANNPIENDISGDLSGL